MIKRSVGKNGTNASGDVKIVQKLINIATVFSAPVPIDSSLAGCPMPPLIRRTGVIMPLKPLAEDGAYGPTTQAAIDHVQTKLGVNAAGLIDPRSRTMLLLWPVAFKNPTGKAIRGTDPKGKGHFKASRSNSAGEHQGVDYMSTVGQKIKAPMSGYVSRTNQPYGSGVDASTLKGVNIVGADGKVCKIWYMKVEPNIVETFVTAGVHDVGTSLTLQNRHGSKMTEHTHVEIRNHVGGLLDPTTLIK